MLLSPWKTNKDDRFTWSRLHWSMFLSFGKTYEDDLSTWNRLDSSMFLSFWKSYEDDISTWNRLDLWMLLLPWKSYDDDLSFRSRLHSWLCLSFWKTFEVDLCTRRFGRPTETISPLGFDSTRGCSCRCGRHAKMSPCFWVDSCCQSGRAYTTSLPQGEFICVFQKRLWFSYYASLCFRAWLTRDRILCRLSFVVFCCLRVRSFHVLACIEILPCT